MFKKFLITLLILFTFTFPLYSAGTSDGSSKINNFKKASSLIKQAKKYEKKGKIKKAEKKFKKALEYLIITNKNNPNQPDTLNYLGFASRKIGKYKEAEEYYLAGLKIKPNHNGINEYLGELYISTNRIEKAKERLKVLENCNCEEFKELKNSINKGSSKY
jgi:tetratricopeptide (TPR) repeat protein|tara:strand:- start:161 stop:643 length:483 start_codon:yes stop_codon:yes gene_type:complete